MAGYGHHFDDGLINGLSPKSSFRTPSLAYTGISYPNISNTILEQYDVSFGNQKAH